MFAQGALYNPDAYLDDPDLNTEEKLDRLKKSFEEYKFQITYFNNPREKYQNYLLQAKQVEVNGVDRYILDEIERMKAELER